MEREAVLVESANDATVVTGEGRTDRTVADESQLRWGPIWAGLLTALGLFILLSVTAIALGLQAAPGVDENLGILASLVTSVIALAAFFLGGLVAAWSANVTETMRGALNGFLVWTLWVFVVLLLAGFGLGQIVGAAADLFGQVRVQPPDIDPAQLGATLRAGAWQTLLALALTAVSAILGGVVGTREELRRRWVR